MKKLILTLAAICGLSVNIWAKGDVKVTDLGTFKLHTYYSGDVMGDASYVVEGNTGLVTMESPLFKEGAAEFDAYVKKLGKPVVARIADYHIGATGNADIIVAQGMKKEIEQGGYAAMINGFKKNFGDAMVLPTGKMVEQEFDKDFVLAGVTFRFNHGPATDFPAASILIGGKVYLTHWAATQAHMNALQISSPAVLDAEIAEAKQALKSKCEVYAGCHGGNATKADMKFKLKYLKTLKKLYLRNQTADAFVAAVKKAYPRLQGEEGLSAVAANLYK